nr:ATP synthase F0 subunit 6 [Tropiduchidae sp. 1 WQW-2023a]
MMTSLFSSFDPSTNLYQMNWMMMMMVTMILPMNFWLNKSRWTTMKNNLEKKIYKEMMNVTNHKEMIILSMSTFMFIMTNNLMGLVPYNFTSTSHMALNMSMALPIWLSMIVYSWINHTNKMFSHILPKGTPSMIMPMMIIIETIGILIRPISLSVRLMANMIAGHLLMTLLGNNNQIQMMTLILPIQMMLVSFETCISMIQAYVFSTLITLYSSESP